MIKIDNPLCKKNNEISGIGLKKVIESLPTSIISRASRNILLCVCEVAASSSEYKLFKSKKRMAEEAGVTVATVRRNLDLAVSAGILTQAYVFDDVKGQCPTEYQFTREFLAIARHACDLLVSRTRDAAGKLKALFAEFALSLAAKHCPGLRVGQMLRQRAAKRKAAENLVPIPPDQIDTPPPDQNDPQLKDFGYSEKLKTYSPPGKVDGIGVTIKRLKDAVVERAQTRAHDLAERKNQEYAQRAEEIKRTESEIKRRKFLMGKAGNGGAGGTTHNASRFTVSNQEHDQALKNAASDFKRAIDKGFNPQAFVANLRDKLGLGRPLTCSLNHARSFCSDSQEE
ncbi:hypothetical protein [Escherichia coli]|uniref:hypothetical protein n=1 Tax=Escherichia coli TaxID=562 RepID=UPI00111C02B6|nr:hypothetical protein [Escherichia coli]